MKTLKYKFNNPNSKITKDLTHKLSRKKMKLMLAGIKALFRESIMISIMIISPYKILPKISKWD